MSRSTKAQETTFYEELQNSPDLDTRDERGMIHDMPFVLLGLVIGLLRGRDGNLSSIHRCMQNTHSCLCHALEVEIEDIISRSHLPIFLGKVNLPEFESLLFKHYQIVLNDEEKDWFAGDGKELRGSIEKGDKRGDALVQLVQHGERSVLGQSYYNGKKESEKPCLQALVEQTGANKQKVTADALHLCPKMTELFEGKGGIFLIGLKGNQKELLQDMIDHTEAFRHVNHDVTLDKGHGRAEIREYWQYDVSGEYFEERWSRSGFRSLIKIKRWRTVLKTNKQSIEYAYYISNGETLKDDKQYFSAVREHWSVEVSNHIRDVSLKEDSLRTKQGDVTKLMAGLRTLVTKLFQKWKLDSIVAQIDNFKDDFLYLINQLKKINFL